MLDRLIGALDAGIEEDEQVDAADRDDPEEEEAERAELRERIERGPEQALERPLDQRKSCPKHAADGADHIALRFIRPSAVHACAERIHSRRMRPPMTRSENAAITLPNTSP